MSQRITSMAGVVLAGALAASSPATAEPALTLPQAMQACIDMGADKAAMSAFAAERDLAAWSDAEQSAFLQRAYDDARNVTDNGVRFQLEIADVAGWNIGDGLSLYYLHTIGTPEITTPVMTADGSTVTYSRTESLHCEVGGFGSTYRDEFYIAVNAVPLGSWMHAFRRNVGLSFVDDRQQARYFLSVSGPGMAEAIEATLGSGRPASQVILTEPAYGRPATPIDLYEPVTIPKAQLDALLDQGSSFGFWVERTPGEAP